MENGEAGFDFGTTAALSTEEKTRREEQWNKVQLECAKITDKLGLPIDKGILDTVVALKIFGINTTGSCEGHIGRGIAAPWVDVQAPQTEETKKLGELAKQAWNMAKNAEKTGMADKELAPLYGRYHELTAKMRRPDLEEMQKVTHLLTQFYQDRLVNYDRMLTFHGYRLESQATPLQAINPTQEQEKKLLEYREEMQLFAEFLRKKYFSPQINTRLQPIIIQTRVAHIVNTI